MYITCYYKPWVRSGTSIGGGLCFILLSVKGDEVVLLLVNALQKNQIIKTESKSEFQSQKNLAEHTKLYLHNILSVLDH